MGEITSVRTETFMGSS